MPGRRWAHLLCLGLWAVLAAESVAAEAPVAPALVPAAAASVAREPVRRLLVAPHDTDDRLADAEPPHLVAFAPGRQNALLVVWLSGSGGKPAPGPQRFYETVLQQGYRLAALSYLNTPAVSQVCVRATLQAQPDCAGRLRQHRAWGQPITHLVADRPEDAIVPRLTRLLQHLARSDPAGDWSQYLDGDQPRWARLVLAGQSQGGGMAAFIAQTRAVAGVLMFSGGWDRQGGGDLAAWYARPSATPLSRWHGVFHAQEPQADALARAYRRLGLLPDQVHRLTAPVDGTNPHLEGLGNPAYQPLWVQMLSQQP